MISNQFILDVNHELIIDNFAGGGGASTGIELALGRHVDIAINHDPEAVAMHAANHPQTKHYCESVWEIDPLAVTQGRPVGLVWLSPDCKHFSKAKGGKPVEKTIRGLAWVALRWIAKTKPRVLMLENVEEFVTWGPLIAGPDGKLYPCPKRKGRNFSAFCNAMRKHGYDVEYRELRACDYGAPTIRKRLALIARRDGQPIGWPAPTHGDPKSPAVKAKRLKPWRTAAECIDWAIPCPSIFERKRPLADATCRRIAKGIMRYVVNAGKPFIVPVTHQGGDRVYPLSQSMRTVTGAHRGEFALISPVLTEHANASSPRCMPADEPLRTICAQTKGGHHALVSAFLAKHYTGVVGSGLDQPTGTVTSVDHHSLVTAHIQRDFGASVGHAADGPLATVTPGGGGKAAIVTSHIAKLRGDNVGSDSAEPLHTISAGGTHHAEVRAFLIKYYGTDQDPRLAEPLHTITTKDRYGLVTIAGEQYAITDIGLRMLSPRELYKAQGFPDSYVIGDNPEQGLTLTKEAQVRMCGNSVCPPLATALVRANIAEIAIRRRFA